MIKHSLSNGETVNVNNFGSPVSESSELERGRNAAKKLSDSWPDTSWVPEEPTQTWAQGALQEFSEIISQQPPIFRASQRGAEIGASMLSPRPFQGLSESLQNADDLEASELRVVLRHRPQRELLLIHNGKPVSLAHVGAMVLAWLSTKDGDEQASGRFGIGQKTLKALGGPLEMHCAPFHFVMDDDGPKCVEPAAPIKDLYEPKLRETMLIVPLKQEIGDTDIRKAVKSLGVASLIFLRHIRSLSFVDLEASVDNLTFSIDEGSTKEIDLHIGKDLRTVRHNTLKIESPDDLSGIKFERYWTTQPVPSNLKRQNKATGNDTPLGICVCSDPDQVGALYDRVPLPIEIDGPISLNAQFDPDGARSSVIANKWNTYCLATLGEFLSAVALNAFEHDLSVAWMHVPLSGERIGGGQWLQEQYENAIVKACHSRLVDDLHVPTRGGAVPISSIIYECKEVEGLITASDLEALAVGHSALLPACRDEIGRWREVLDDLRQSRRLELDDALQLFDHSSLVNGRKPVWFVEMAALAIANSVWSQLSKKDSILLNDGTLVACPSKSDPRVLVSNEDPQSLPGRLGLALPLHVAYFSESPSAERVVATLLKNNILHESCDQPFDAIQLLARSDDLTVDPIRVADNDLLALREAWEQLAQEQQDKLGRNIGTSIELRTVMYEDSSNSPIRSWARPIDTYLSASIDGETDNFAKAAAKTPGLIWIDPKYAKLLKKKRGRAAVGAQRFLVALGASRGPQLIAPLNEKKIWARDPRPASAVTEIHHPVYQRQAISDGKSGDFYLLNDRWSPHLDMVVESIQSSPARVRRQRALALLAVLSRGWGRHYSKYQTATVVVGRNGYWRNSREIQATWLARLSSTSWLPNGNGALRPPNQLALPTEANRLIYGVRRKAYLAKTGKIRLRDEFLEALGIRIAPSTDDLIAMLRSLQDKPITSKVSKQANTIYGLLAASLRTNAASIATSGAMTSRRIRNAFRAKPGHQGGLLLASGQWHSPESVLSGPPIFGNYRVFSPNISGLEPLWSALEIPEPTAQDCVTVLKELTRNPSLSSSDRGVMVTTLRKLATLIKETSPQFRTALRRLPLWTGRAWSTDRPMYVLEGVAIAMAGHPSLSIWRSGLTSFSDLQTLFPILGVIQLRPEDFQPKSLSGAGIVEGASKRKQFAKAIVLLKDELIRNDIRLHDSISCDWHELIRGQFIIDPALEIEIQLEGQPTICLPVRSHVMREPLILIVRTIEDAEAAEAGGQAIASLFTHDSDRQKLAWAWTSVWRRAHDDKNVNEIIVPSTKPTIMSAVTRLAQLQAQAKDRENKQKKPKQGGGKAKITLKPAIQIRQLRDIDDLEPSEGAIVNEGVKNNGVVLVRTGSKGQAGRSFKKESRVDSQPYRQKNRTVLPSTGDREDLALEAVRRALRLDPDKIQDVRKKRGIGVDAIDELRQCYEIKMCSSPEFPAEVSLTPSELDAAKNDPDFFLAVIAGLEDDDKFLRVRFIFEPLEQLAVKISGGVTLTGVREAEALEYKFRTRNVHLDP